MLVLMRCLGSSSFLVLAMVGGSPALAQSASEAVPHAEPASSAGESAARSPASTGVAGDIIVTAQRRESTVREVPFSIAAFGGSQLAKQQVFSPVALVSQVPGITINTSDKSLSIVAIRGNVSTFRTATLDTPVAFFVDDVYYVANNDLNNNFFDISRVEVLRGPQGTLFGRNVVGGAISVFTNNPTFNNDYSAQITGGNGGYIRTEGMLNGVLAEDKLAMRVAFSTEHSDGLIKTPNQPGNYGELNSFGVRGKLLFTPNPDLKVVLSGDYSYTSGNGGAVQLQIGGPQTIPATFGKYTQGNWINNDVNPSPYDQRLRGGYLRADQNLFGGTLTSITGYRLNDTTTFLDNIPVATSTPVFGLGTTVRNRSFTQEVRYASAPGRLTYVIGGYYLHSNIHIVNGLNYSPLPGSSTAAAIPPNPTITNITRDQNGRVRSFAFFGEFTFNLTDSLAVVAGGRYSKDTKSIDYLGYSTTNGRAAIPAFAFPGYVSASGGKSWDAFTPRVTVKWKPIEQVNLYATYVKGFKSGGFVDNAYSNPTIPLNPEKATNIEVGFKSRFFNNRVDLNLSVFRQKTNNLQNYSGAGGIAHTYNGSEVTSGAELESVFRVTNDLRFNLNYAHVEGHYTSLKDPLAAADYTGNPIKYTPQDSFILGGSYTHHVAQGSLTLQGDFNFASRVHTDDADTLPLSPSVYNSTRARTLNSRLTYDTNDGRWSLGLWVKNLTNNYQVVLADDITAFLAPASGPSHYWKVFTNSPRTFGVTLSVKR